MAAAPSFRLVFDDSKLTGRGALSTCVRPPGRSFDVYPTCAIQPCSHRARMAETELGLVPEIYYDVIARLCAGAPFVAVAFWAYPAVRTLPALVLGLTTVFGSYLVG